MNPPSEDIADLIIQTSGLSLALGINLFLGIMPDTPDYCVCISDTGGFAPQPNYIYLRPTIQVRIRGNAQGYQASWDDAETLRDTLHGVTSTDLNSTRYAMIIAMSDILFLGYDDNQRPEFSINFEIHRY